MLGLIQCRALDVRRASETHAEQEPKERSIKRQGEGCDGGRTKKLRDIREKRGKRVSSERCKIYNIQCQARSAAERFAHV